VLTRRAAVDPQPSRVANKYVRPANGILDAAQFVLLPSQNVAGGSLLQDVRECSMSHTDKTHVAFAIEDVKDYREMTHWRTGKPSAFDFSDNHDLYVSEDVHGTDTLTSRVRERLGSAKQVVLLGSENAKLRGSDGSSVLAVEVAAIIELRLPVVVANLDNDWEIETDFIPIPFLDVRYHAFSVPFQPEAVRHALDEYAAEFANSKTQGLWHYSGGKFSD
jgi:hypothetical protein